MKSFWLTLVLLMQAGPQAPRGVGIVTGVVRGPNGMPASGIRVYAIGVRDSLEALNTGTAPLEGLTQTDASGRYRLEVAAGRYYIASGSVTSPTFYPGTARAAEARVVTVTVGGLVEAIDFSSFVAAQRSPGLVTIARGTAVISGVLRFPDGTPAAGIPVIVVSSALVTSAAGPAFSVQRTLIQLVPPNFAFGASGPPSPIQPVAAVVFSGNSGQFLTTSDASGRYTVANLPADSFYIAAGYAEASALYPGVPDLAAAKAVTTTPTTNVNTVDLTIPRPPTGKATVRGRVTTIGDVTAGGVRVDIVNASPPPPSVVGLPTLFPNRFVNTDLDGRFEFAKVQPGSYTVRASYSAIYSESKSIVVADQPVEGVDFLLRTSALSGRVLDESGNPIPDVQLFAEALVSTASNPNIVASTIFPIAKDGSFGRIIEAEEYRFFIRTLPNEYSLKSITAGSVDLMKETLKFTGNESVKVDVRVAKRTSSTESSTLAVGVKGRALDVLSGVSSVAERVTLCCRESGPVERFSTPLQPDGSFEFAAIPPGRYTVGLQTKTGTPNLFPVVHDIVVGSNNISELEVLSAPQFAELAARLVLDNGSFLPDNFSATLVFTGSNGRVRVAATARGGIYLASVPVGDRYSVSVTDLPQGYTVKSSPETTEARPTNYPAIGAPTPLAPIVITLTRESR